jgi:hypothetical protein
MPSLSLIIAVVAGLLYLVLARTRREYAPSLAELSRIVFFAAMFVYLLTLGHK